ncbi:MAG: hypothetical protein LBI20_00995 [Holosporales bacterium]|jgi:DNA-binding NarL/FixJ family response regulator|nr:hypothetical protein [Holosporales bacterium]
MKNELMLERQQFSDIDGLLSKHKRRNAWTKAELEILRRGFLSGKRIKTIAYEIGRSETAVHKFLSRSGIHRANKIRTQ